MLNDLDRLLEEIEDLLEALTNPDRKISGKSEEETVARYKKFVQFRKSVILLLNELNKTIEEHKGEDT